VRGGLLTGQHIAVGVSPQHFDTGQRPQEPERLGRPGPEKHQVSEDPPPVHAEAGCVVKHRPQRDLVTVDVGNYAKSHAGKHTSEATVRSE
jgi:hypothetical protein